MAEFTPLIFYGPANVFKVAMQFIQKLGSGMSIALKLCTINEPFQISAQNKFLKS